MEGLTIGQLAKGAGVGVETVRFYERKGLVPRPEKPWRSYRRYPAEAIRRIQFIKRGKTLGFTLNEIADLLALRMDSSTSCAEVRARAEAKIRMVGEKIKALRDIHSALEKLASRCAGDGPLSTCPILGFLEKEVTP